ncbi:MAG TPA: bifunctional phosphopantothenoylcysteine decarboxylase/phosphopantothenate--cysteine ligase CoaBC [Edaphobacter sp.]|uniref:bifunctional phosphopantothenoylcysteine decarboxylase/phosphopantothenate--cysteine ligase CoaBC n=1 Tax=Edaphobacter sp. TaxID=1934404 RepID=UPI002CCE0CF3|nr:bifunctional phosphopantothenoylcysteine decarboxylase/phosphopantothenate--cysteine ligase CoaBC [Edaphobacter sp.]HUZ96634.1 bifunctional phosphopantothenoylcysteine decarboxylase/phosphopantothenate--cysteine ligase CoaBC [Edaphobacter sp.]
MCAQRIKVTVAVSGGIAAYKSVELVRLLQEAGFDPHVVMTRAAEEFVRPLTFAAITGHKVITSLWSEDAGIGSEEDEEAESGIEHINEAQTTRALIVAPATAHVLARFAHGLADDFLSTMYLATTAPVIMAPAMNVNMWNHPATRANVETLRTRGVTFVEPGSGYLACGMVGGGRLADNTAILAAVQATLAATSDLAGETILVTAGGTREAIDPVRFIGNRSSGRMGFAIAEAAQRRGARVILISAPTTIAPPSGCEVVCVTSAAEMQAAALQRLNEATIVVMAAAVSDYTVKTAPQKLKRDGARTLELEPTPDILREIAARRNPGTLVIGFAAETENILANGRAKLERKGVDAIVVNDVSSPHLGFDSKDNAGTILTKDNEVAIPPTSKAAMAQRILDEIKKLRTSSNP